MLTAMKGGQNVDAHENGATIARVWLAEMQACVQTVDYERCRAIFAGDVVGFGTYAALVVGLEALEENQWRRIWGTIRDFAFLTDELHCGLQGETVWLACPWMSRGPGPDETWIERPGRITAILARRDGRWLAVHTHHSVAPRPT